VYARRNAAELDESLRMDTEEWKRLIPGKQILNVFASRAKLDIGMLKTLFIKRAACYSPSPFDEIIEIFERFSEAT
jgi:hypothetical protein